MTTERRPVSPSAPVRARVLELRLYAAALLAAVYTLSWRAIGAHAPATERVAASPLPPSEPQRFVSGDRTSPSVQPAIHVPDRRVPRLRTRSS